MFFQLTIKNRIKLSKSSLLDPLKSADSRRFPGVESTGFKGYKSEFYNNLIRFFYRN